MFPHICIHRCSVVYLAEVHNSDGALAFCSRSSSLGWKLLHKVQKQNVGWYCSPFNRSVFSQSLLVVFSLYFLVHLNRSVIRFWWRRKQPLSSFFFLIKSNFVFSVPEETALYFYLKYFHIILNPGKVSFRLQFFYNLKTHTDRIVTLLMWKCSRFFTS